MARIEKTVFISYRRTDVYTALAVYQSLSSKGYDVFFDYTSITSGDFEQIIVSNIKARAHFLLILTPTALDRCNEPGDWLRREIETAIDEKRNIIPLFFKGFKFSAPSIIEKLTGKLGYLNRYNGLNVHEDYFNAAMDRLSNQFLNIPLETILHPVSSEVQKVVEEVQVAAEEALLQEQEETQGLIKAAKGTTSLSKKINESQSKSMSARKRAGQINKVYPYGIGVGILLIGILSVFGLGSIFRNLNGKATTTPTIAPEEITVKFTQTPTRLTSTVTSTVPPVTPTPEFGIDSTSISPKDGMTLLYVPAGEFTMGNNDGYRDEKPVHTVYLDAFWIDQTEITNAMYAMCVLDGDCVSPDYNVSYTRGRYYGDSRFDDYPVIYASWFDANAYCSWSGRRLPTEAEWEKVASGLNRRRYPWGERIDCSFANYSDKAASRCVGDTTPVGSYPDGASSYGALDMAGNVWEWVQDWYGDTYYDTSPSSNPQGPNSGVDRVLRGGSFTTDFSSLITFNRNSSHPTNSLYHFGIRCAMDAD